MKSFLNTLNSDGNDEAYNIYDKPWRSENTLSNHLYRPPKNRDGELYGDDIESIAKQKRFVPDRGFDGADQSAPRGSGPVQFEKDADDVFGVDKPLAEVKKVRPHFIHTNFVKFGQRDKKSQNEPLIYIIYGKCL